MQAADLKAIAERRPFRPFSVRLSNGARYTFSEPRSFGAPADYHVILHFGETDYAILDAENIVEIQTE